MVARKFAIFLRVCVCMHALNRETLCFVVCVYVCVCVIAKRGIGAAGCTQEGAHGILHS